MGIIHKLTPELREFIQKEKHLNPHLSCRRISQDIKDKFQLKISKSTVNSVFQDSGLSLSVGRRYSPERVSHYADTSGVIFLRALDCLLGVSAQISQEIKATALGQEISEKIEDLIFSRFYSLLLNKSIPEEYQGYIARINQDKNVLVKIREVLNNAFKFIACIKAELSDGNSFYLDGQMHNIWSGMHIPHNFSSGLLTVRKSIQEYFSANNELVLFFAPGWDAPTKEFFNFSSGSSSLTKKIVQLKLFDTNSREIESIKLDFYRKLDFVIGIWPWQFGVNEKLRINSEFSKIKLAFLGKEFFAAQAEVELNDAQAQVSVKLSGCVLKDDPLSKTRLIIASNAFTKNNRVKEMAYLYLSRWPNMEESFRDFSQKVEASVRKKEENFPDYQGLINQSGSQELDFNGVIDLYFNLLDTYFKTNFLLSPGDHKVVDSKSVYLASASCRKIGAYLEVALKAPQQEDNIRKLEYACLRLNERGITFANGKKLWCKVKTA